ncbi:DNA-binding transcription factor yap1 [Entomophthora muscae]|uniref:DNA-binding transcription factor yap1 n=1 Tax=Entomophthora muscae TaxID=34485 RepID=A0ACC2UDD7_9FUNG|nr:DNA-binding transcription factor yap1 [Entomophthora muscae]
MSQFEQETPIQTEQVVLTEKRRLDTRDSLSDQHSKHQAVEKVRKKPGRKPSNMEPANKRLAQNRAAQRAFRERKDTYVKDLESKVQELEEARLAAEKENKLLQARLDALENKPAKPESSSKTETSTETYSPVAKSSPVKEQTSEPPMSIPESYTPSLEDYMIPFGSYLGFTPQIQSEEPLISQPYGQSLDTNFDINPGVNYYPMSYDYSVPQPGMEPPSPADPVLYADFVQNYDPLSANIPFHLMSPQPLCNSLPPNKEEQDLDLLCSLLKDKATCFEVKRFYSSCKDTPV